MRFLEFNHKDYEMLFPNFLNHVILVIQNQEFSLEQLKFH